MSLCVIRLPLAILLSRTSLGLAGVWVGAACSFPFNATFGYLYYRSGKWQRPVVHTREQSGAAHEDVPMAAAPGIEEVTA